MSTNVIVTTMREDDPTHDYNINCNKIYLCCENGDYCNCRIQDIYYTSASM